MQVKRNEVHARADAATFQLFDELVPSNPQMIALKPQDVQVPRGFSIRQLRRSLQTRDPVESSRVAFSNGLPRGAQGITLAQLHQADGRLQVGHIVFKTRLKHSVKPGIPVAVAYPGISFDPVETHDPHSLG